MNNIRFAVLAAAILGVTVSAWAADPATSLPLPQIVELKGGARIAFSTAGGRLALASLRDGKDTEWAGSFGDKDALWRLALRGPNAATVELTSDTASLIAPAVEGTGVRFTWKARAGDGEARVSLSVNAEADDGLSRWQLRAELPDRWRVARADWPILSNIRIRAGLKMAAPFGWGLEYDVKPGMSYDGTYPSLVAAMPFVAFYGDGRGLYLGVHDKKGHHKHLSVKAREVGAGVTFTHWPSDADTAGGRYAPDFHAVVGVFDGDYWNAARIYRTFSRETRWGRPYDGLQLSSPSRRVPAWLKNTELWLMPGPEPLKNVEACRKAGEFFGVPIALHWYSWHEIPFDTLYPDFFPPKPSFREGVKALQAAGFRVMPYINGRLCDPKSKTWTCEGADKAAARQDNGEVYAEVYGTKIPLNVMCPAAPQWRNKIAGVVDRLVNEIGVDGVYIDQIGAANAVRCFSTEHGHSSGGGTLWSDGYRQMLEQIRAKLPEGRILTTEENAECWNDQFDALLMVNTPAGGDRRIIPLMPAVYAGRVITFGFQYIAASDISRSLPFRAKMGREFLWGAQLGWVSVDAIMSDTARKEAEFLRNLARARQGAHDFLLNGEFLGEAEVRGDNPRLTDEAPGGGERTIDLPAVMATAWLAADQAVGIAVVNLSDQPRTVEVVPPWHRLRELVRAGAPIPGSRGSPRDRQPKTVSIAIPARDARLIRLPPAKAKS